MVRAHQLEHDQQTIDQVTMLGNQANEKMYEANYKGAIDNLNNAIVRCGRCKLLGALEKNLGLAYCLRVNWVQGSENLRLQKL